MTAAAHIATGREQATLAPALADPVYTAIMHLREPGALEARIRSAWSRVEALPSMRVRVLQTHYKPFARARIVAEMVFDQSAGARENQYLFINVYATVERARDKYLSAAEASLLKRDGPRVMLFDDIQAVVWALPNGPKLKAMHFCFDPGGFARFLVEHEIAPSSIPLPQLIRYVPRKRALFRYRPGQSGAAVYIKIYGSGEDGHAARNLTLLAETAAQRELKFCTPRLLVHDSGRRAVVMTEVAGLQLTEEIHAVESLSAVGHALASLHNSRVQASKSWSPEAEITALARAMADVKTAVPAVTDRIDGLLERIQDHRLTFNEDGPMHGNLFGDQILVDSGRVGIVDWDDLATGDPLYDVGRLIAHLIYISRRAETRGVNVLLNAYAGATNRTVDVSRLRWHIAVALLMRAKISALRMLPAGWMEDIAMAIAETDRILAGKGEWLPA